MAPLRTTLSTIRRSALVVAWLFAAWLAHAAEDPADDLVAKGLAAEARGDTAVALDCFRRAHALRPDDAVINQKISKQLFDQTFATPDPEIPALAREALVYAERAVELDPDSALNVLSVAIIYGQLAVFGDNKTKVQHARRIRRLAERALELDPDYAEAHMVLGRWHVDVGRLGFAKRVFVSLFYGGLPKASLKTGIAHLERALELQPHFVANRVELGYALAAAGRDELAVEYWRAALEQPAGSVYDVAAQNRAKLGLRKLGHEATGAAH